MKIYTIGDVHGCLKELEQLMSQVLDVIQPEDVIVFLGDYVDRGPDSKGVIDYILDLKEKISNNIVTLLGNHEDMMMYDEELWAHNGGRNTLYSYDSVWSERTNWKTAVPQNHWEFLRNLELSYKVGRFVFVHAGIIPYVPYAEQTSAIQDLIWSRSWVGFDGDYIDGSFVIYGHTPKSEMVIKKNQRGIDTSCVFGGKLTCLIVDTEQEPDDWKTIEVKSSYDYRKNY